MKKARFLAALSMLGVMALGAWLPGASASAAHIQPLPFNVFVNSDQVNIKNSLLYQGHTYVQLRELTDLTNMNITFVSPNQPQLPMPGGGLPIGISIDQPTFVYVKDKVQDIDHKVSSDGYFQGVDITGIYLKYDYYIQNTKKRSSYRYAFKTGHTQKDLAEPDKLIVPEGNGTKEIPMEIIHSYGHFYVTVDEFRTKIQPYLVDISMQ